MSLAAIISNSDVEEAFEVELSKMVEVSLNGGMVLLSAGKPRLSLDWKWKEKIPSDDIFVVSHLTVKHYLSLDKLKSTELSAKFGS